MKKFDEWQFPDHEEHLQLWLHEVRDVQHGRLCYQGHKYRSAVKHCKKKRRALDVGAHIGLWSFMMAHDFERVVGWEPMVAHAECFRANMAGYLNVELIECALGSADGFVTMATYTPDSSGDTRVANHFDTQEVGAVPMVKIDSYAFDDVDFIKVDCEGYELFVLEGAEETLKRCKPIVVVEQKRDMSEQFGIKKLAAVEYLEGLGAVQIDLISGDHIMGWR